jgi:hypothetical protein
MNNLKYFNEGQKVAHWELVSKISDIVDSNVKEVPYEGK